jgi:hypothetical protein
MVDSVGPAVGGVDDPFWRTLTYAAQQHQRRLQTALDLGVFHANADSPGHNVVSKIIDQSGISGENLATLWSALGDLQEKMSDLVEEARRGGSVTSGFSIAVDNAEIDAVFTRVLLGSVFEVTKPALSDQAARGALMLMAASLESLVADLASALLKEFPAKLGGTELRLSKIEDLGSVEAVRDYAVARAVEKIMRGGIQEWASWFEQFGVDWKSIPQEWWSFLEIDARRNLIAHADGHVNDIYLGIGKGNGATNLPPVGEVLEPSVQYLENTFTDLSAFGVLLVSSVLMKHRANRLNDVYKWASFQADQLLIEGQSASALRVASKLISIAHGRLPRRLEMAIRATEWSARKRTGGTASIRSEVEGYDFTGLDLTVQHVRAVLLDEDDLACEQILTLIDRGQIARATVRMSPMYEDLRDRQGVSWLGG